MRRLVNSRFSRTTRRFANDGGSIAAAASKLVTETKDLVKKMKKREESDDLENAWENLEYLYEILGQLLDDR
jgi:hypothetical protein